MPNATTRRPVATLAARERRLVALAQAGRLAGVCTPTMGLLYAVLITRTAADPDPAPIPLSQARSAIRDGVLALGAPTGAHVTDGGFRRPILTLVPGAAVDVDRHG